MLFHDTPFLTIWINIAWYIHSPALSVDTSGNLFFALHMHFQGVATISLEGSEIPGVDTIILEYVSP